MVKQDWKQNIQTIFLRLIVEKVLKSLKNNTQEMIALQSILTIFKNRVIWFIKIVFCMNLKKICLC